MQYFLHSSSFFSTVTVRINICKTIMSFIFVLFSLGKKETNANSISKDLDLYSRRICVTWLKSASQRKGQAQRPALRSFWLFICSFHLYPLHPVLPQPNRWLHQDVWIHSSSKKKKKFNMAYCLLSLAKVTTQRSRRGASVYAPTATGQQMYENCAASILCCVYLYRSSYPCTKFTFVSWDRARGRTSLCL